MRTRFRWAQCVSVGAFVLAAAVATPAQAGSIIFFGATPTSGVVGYLGGTDPLFGLGLTVDGIISLGTPLNDGVLATCVGCELTFVTDNFLLGNATAWSFDGGGYFSINGGVDLTGNASLGDLGDIAAGSTLFSGSFASTPFVSVQAGANPFVGVGFSYLDGQLNSGLASFFGESSDAQGVLAFHFNGVGEAPGAFASFEVLDVTAVAVSVREPSSLLLLATSLLGFGLCRRRFADLLSRSAW